MTKLSFAIENVEEVEIPSNSSFATLRMDVFASGLNLHDLTVSEETLTNTAESIKEKPIIWEYDRLRRDAGSHGDGQVPVGFIPHNTEIEYRIMPDGRKMLVVVGKIWKKYSGRILDFFRREEGKKSVSVEMTVLKMEGKELKDFIYEGITVLGKKFSPAIPGAMAEVVSFSKEREEYQKLYEIEFAKYSNLDFTIPAGMKRSAKKGLEMCKEHGYSANSVSLATARFIGKSETMTPERVRQLNKFFTRKKEKNEIVYNLMGGNSGKDWTKFLVEEMDKKDNEIMSYFAEGGDSEMPYKSLDEVNPAIKGIEPPVTLSQANTIAKQSEGIGVSEEKNGWAIAISNFKKTHKVEDGKWIRKENMSAGMEDEYNMKDKEKEEGKDEEEMATPEKEMPKEEMAEEEKPEDEEKKPEEEMMADEPESDKEKEDEDKEKMPEEDERVYCVMESAYRILGIEEDIASLREKLHDMDFVSGVMDKLTEKFSAMSSNIEELQKFKSDVETKEFDYRVDMTLKSVEKVMPKDELEFAKENSRNYSLETFDVWSNSVRAKAFEFSQKTGPDKSSFEFTRIQEPQWVKNEKAKSLWK